jgi:hypothetical protein
MPSNETASPANGNDLGYLTCNPPGTSDLRVSALGLPDLQLIENKEGSSGRTRTYNPSVNRLINELLLHYAGLCFNVFLCVFAQET